MWSVTRHSRRPATSALDRLVFSNQAFRLQCHRFKNAAFHWGGSHMTTIARTLLASCALLALPQIAHAQAASPWPVGDEIGMANTLGPATWKRCAPFLADAKAKSYE